MPRTTWTLEFRTVFCLYILCDIPCPFNRLISGLGAHVLSFADPDGVDPDPNEYPRKKTRIRIRTLKNRIRVRTKKNPDPTWTFWTWTFFSLIIKVNKTEILIICYNYGHSLLKEKFDFRGILNLDPTISNADPDPQF